MLLICLLYRDLGGALPARPPNSSSYLADPLFFFTEPAVLFTCNMP